MRVVPKKELKEEAQLRSALAVNDTAIGRSNERSVRRDGWMKVERDGERKDSVTRTLSNTPLVKQV